MTHVIDMSTPEKAQAVLGGIAKALAEPRHHAGTVLHNMAQCFEGTTLLALHMTAYGDRAIVEYSEDPHWLYEVEIRPVRRADLDDSAMMLHKPKD